MGRSKTAADSPIELSFYVLRINLGIHHDENSYISMTLYNMRFDFFVLLFSFCYLRFRFLKLFVLK